MFHRTILFTAVTALLTAPTIATTTATVSASTPGALPCDDPSSVILDWECTSMLTVYGPFAAAPRTPIPVGVLHLGFVSLAMHDAVERSAARAHSSEAAAAATAAHDVLREYFPASAADLDAALAASLADVPDGRDEDAGAKVGEKAAARMIVSRKHDGRGDTSIVYSKPMEPGFWQPPANPPAGNMLAPWLGSVDPLVLKTLVTVDGPDSLTSDDYTEDYDEVLDLGSLDSVERTPFETDTARFYNSNSAVMVGEGLIGLLEDEPLGLRDTALLFAVMHGAMADSVIKAWELKRDVGFWRPFQAIAGWDTDGNPDTGPWTGTGAWEPLIPNPPYADYVSGHASLTAPAVETIRMMLGEDTDLTLHSYPTDSDRSYDDLSTIEFEAFHARIWGGLHFRDAMEDGYALGHETARRVARALR